MKFGIIVSLLFTLVQAGVPPDSSALYRAACDEIARSIEKLKIDKQAKPYYISYRIEDERTTKLHAAFGSVMYSNSNHYRTVYATVRVGNYDMDNSNFACQTRSMNLIDSDQTSLPLEDDYYAIRQALWIVTDGTYKAALERLARKVATLQNQPRRDTVPDFARVQPTTTFEPIRHMEVDTNHWQDIVSRTSAVFKEYPEIQESEVVFQSSTTTAYFLDTEGNQSRTTKTLCMIEVSAKTQSRDGDPLEDRIGFYGLALEDLPDLPHVIESARAMAETLSMEVLLDKEEDYSGPVIFTGQAAAELFFQILGKGVSDPRAPLYENDMLAQSASTDLGGLAKRLGRRVMSDFLSAIDDPLMVRWYGTPLIGTYTVDDEGVPAQPVEIAIDGKLLTVLMSRAPIKRVTATNGHGHYRDDSYGPRMIGLPSNLIITPNEHSRVVDLAAMLVDLCKDYDIPYGIIITRLEATEPLELEDYYMRYFQRMSGGGGEEGILSSPVTAYKVDVATGDVTLIRGLDFADVTPRVLRDIIAVGDENYAYNFIYYDEEGNAYPMSVVAPSVLVEEMDLEGTDTKPTKLPILSHPYFRK